ncbi:Protocadherin-1 [Manis pentadactyla]|nr:Protocadherin-1 [Manis pentadactyla]
MPSTCRLRVAASALPPVPQGVGPGSPDLTAPSIYSTRPAQAHIGQCGPVPLAARPALPTRERPGGYQARSRCHRGRPLRSEGVRAP